MHIEYKAVKRFDSIWEKAVYNDPRLAECTTELEFYDSWIKDRLDRLNNDVEKAIALGYLDYAKKYNNYHRMFLDYYIAVFITKTKEVDMKQLDRTLGCMILYIEAFEYFDVKELNDYYISDEGELIWLLED